ncbi:MAG: 5-(carboxyamino)imidazole ribonucleotide mutase [bacterium]|nr:5-(carboxyamino)imidazole ribonucleotide mutase [bacterium]
MSLKVAVIMGSSSDEDTMAPARTTLEQFGVKCHWEVMSAHRTPEKVRQFVAGARDAGFGAIICGAGMAAHLAGATAAQTTLPVIGVPLAGGALNGVDSLYSTVQMPKGIPVATVAINGAMNAALLAVQILAVTDAGLADKLAAHRAEMAGG